jgi:hypothetical protein
VVVENLRMMLSTHSHNDPSYFELSYGLNDTATGANNAGDKSHQSLNQPVLAHFWQLKLMIAQNFTNFVWFFFFAEF